MRTAAARIAKAIQPHCVLLDSSFCKAAAVAAAAAGLTPDVVVVPEIVVVAGGGTAAATVVVRDSVTVEVGRVGVVTEDAGPVGVVRVPELVSGPTADPFPPPHATRNPAANNANIAAAPSGLNEEWARRVTTRRPSHSRTAGPSPDRDELQRCDQHRRSPSSWTQSAADARGHSPGDRPIRTMQHRCVAATL
jgi:hypothetical protein